MKRWHCEVLRYTILIVLVKCLLSPTAMAQAQVNEPNLAYTWSEIALACTANDTERFRPRPTITSRYLGLIWTAVYDAWSRYDAQASPVYLKEIQRRPKAEHTIRNKEIAISYAAFRVISEYYYSDSIMLQRKMRELGFDPFDFSLDPETPVGIGNLAASSVIESRRTDGSNQYGNMPGSNGMPYTDYSGYRPVNNADSLLDLSRWQPKYFADGKGGRFAPDCLTPFWGKVQPLLLDEASEFRPGPPPMPGSPQLRHEINEVVEMQANLTDEQKALVEFMRDGPNSVQQAGHWLLFARHVSRRDRHTLDQDVMMYFLIQAAAMDAFIACWDTKMYYDFARPFTLVHDQFYNSDIRLWGGAEKGMITAKGKEWRPYSPETFLCPPFPSYVSGHSAVSAACAEVLRLFTGSDKFDLTETRVAGAFTEPGHVGNLVTLRFTTFTETANMAGLSRVLGGYHIQSDNIEGLALGRKVAGAVWKKYLVYSGRQH